MPHEIYLLAPPHPEICQAFWDRPELRRALYLIGPEEISSFPPSGLLIADITVGVLGWQFNPQPNPYWFEPNPHAYNEPESFSLWTPPKTPRTPLVFRSADLEQRFPCTSRDLPPDDMLEFCKALSVQSQQPIAWYSWLERGDSLYHDAAWIFNPTPPTSIDLEPGISFTPAHLHQEEFVVYEALGKQRGWVLWGNDRVESRHHDHMAIDRVALQLGFPHGQAGPFPDYQWDSWWEDFRFLPSFELKMNQLRDLLYQTPSPRLWRSVQRRISTWPAPQNLSEAIRYTQFHISSWPAPLQEQAQTWLQNHPCIAS